MFHNVEPKFHRTLVHLVQRFTVPFASHTRAEYIRCTLKRKMWQMTVIRCHGGAFTFRLTDEQKKEFKAYGISPLPPLPLG